MAASKGKSKPRRRGPRISFILLGLTLLALAGTLAYGPTVDDLYQGLTNPDYRPPSAEEVSLVVAARDTEYCGYHTACGPGMRTDTIFYMRLRGSEATLVAIPRDLHYKASPCGTEGTCEPSYEGKINAVYERGGGAEGLRQAVENVLGVPVQHYVILTFDSVMKLVNAVDGVDVVLPYPMKYTDRAAGLFIDFPAGKNHLDGKDAVKYMRFRRWEGSDLGRLDRIKDVLSQVAHKAQNPRYWPRLPGVANQTWNSLETSLPLSKVISLLPALRGITIRSATIPTLEQGNDLIVDEGEKASFVSGLLGYASDSEAYSRLSQAQSQGFKVLILDQSGSGLGQRYLEGFARLGLPQPELETAEVASTSAVYVKSGLSIVAQNNPTFALARDYADFLHLPLQTRFRLEPAGYDIIISLGSDNAVQ